MQEEPIFNSKRERDDYYRFLEKSKSIIVPVKIVKSKPLSEPIKSERKNKKLEGQKLHFNYKNDYYKKLNHLPEYRPKVKSAATLIKAKKY